MNSNLCREALNWGGTVTPLLIPSNLTGGTGLANPSIYNDGDRLIMNLRHINYTLYHAEGDKQYGSKWGALSYVHPENDRHLRTINYFCIINGDMQIDKFYKVDTSKFDTDPQWEFIGLEDARLVKWFDKYYLCGVRRDTTSNGVGRIELSQIIEDDDSVKEVTRDRIEPPNNANSYCEKNWMPILDKPYHFVKWSNPTEVVRVYPEEKRSEQVFLSDKIMSLDYDLRGGSHVIKYKDYYYALTHAVRLWNNPIGQKEGKYRHVMIKWDANWNIVSMSSQFSFMTAEIEFCCGMAAWNDSLIMSFSFQDNSSYLLKIPLEKITMFA